MGFRLVAVSLDSHDFRFEQLHAHIELITRIAVQAFAAEEAGRVSTGPGTIVRFHCDAAFYAAALLSTGVSVTRRKRGRLLQAANRGKASGGKASAIHDGCRL